MAWYEFQGLLDCAVIQTEIKRSTYKHSIYLKQSLGFTHIAYNYINVFVGIPIQRFMV